MIDLGRAIKYPFSGPNALSKTFIGALLFVVLPVFFPVLLGYQLRVIRDVIDEGDDGLPEWDRIGEDFVQGIVVFLGSFLYYLPSFIFAALGAKILWGIFVDLRATLDPFDSTPFEVNQADLSLLCLTFVLALLWLVLSAPLVMAAIARYAETGEFSSFTRILVIADEAWEQRGAAGSLMFNLFVLTILTQIVSMFLSFTCLVGVYIQFVQYAALCHLTGQWGKILKDNRPKPSVIRLIKPPPRR